MIPVICEWTGTEMRPLPRFAKACDKQFVIGQNYRIDVQEERSAKSHAHFFASVTEAWNNLPLHWADQFASPDHLRRYALIKAGFYKEHVIPCQSRSEAHRLAALIKPIDEYAIVVPYDDTIRVFTAKSQSLKAMGRAEFQKSKDAVLEVLSGMVGVSAGELEEAAA